MKKYLLNGLAAILLLFVLFLLFFPYIETDRKYYTRGNYKYTTAPEEDLKRYQKSYIFIEKHDADPQKYTDAYEAMFKNHPDASNKPK